MNYFRVVLLKVLLYMCVKITRKKDLQSGKREKLQLVYLFSRLFACLLSSFNMSLENCKVINNTEKSTGK